MRDAPAVHSVLVADADPYICRVFEAKLTKEGRFRVACATAGAEAFRLALEEPFDILLWDLHMRDSDTYLPLLRAICPAAALIGMSTDDQPSMSVTLARLDILEVLVKPLGLDTLESALHALSGDRFQPRTLYFRIGIVGQGLTISTPGGECRTRILDTEQDVFTVVGAPRIVTPPDFEAGRAVVVRQAGLDALYEFDSRLLRSIDKPLPCWELAMPSTLTRRQRRRHPRVPISLPLIIRLDDVTSSVAEAVTTDISASGLAMISKVPLTAGTRISFTLEPSLGGSAEVIWSRKDSAPNHEIQHRMGLRFDASPGPDGSRFQDLLVKRDRLW